MIDNPHGKLLPAMYATVELTADRLSGAISVPLSASFTEGEGEQVCFALGPGRYKRRDTADHDPTAAALSPVRGAQCIMKEIRA